MTRQLSVGIFELAQRLPRSIVAALWLLCSGLALAATPQVLRVDDILKMEDVGRAVIANNDREIVYEWIPPFELAPNKETLYSYSNPRPLARLFAVPVSREQPPRMLFEQQPDGGYWIGSRSPDQRKLAIYSLVNGRVSAGVFDFTTRTVRWFSFTPNYYWLHQTPVWVTSDEILYPTLAEDRQPSVVFRSGLTSRLNALWSRSFSGDEPSATVLVSSPTIMADQMRPGRLIRANLKAQTESILAEGYFYDLKLSADGRYVAALQEGSTVQPDPNLPATGAESWIRRNLVVIDLKSGASSTPCHRCNVSLGSAEWSADGQTLLFFAHAAGSPLENGQLYAYSPRGNVLSAIALPGLQLACSAQFSKPRRSMHAGRGVFVYARRSNASNTFAPSACAEGNRHDWYFVDGRGSHANLTAALADVSGDLIGVTGDSIVILADGRLWRVQSTGRRTNLTPGNTITGVLMDGRDAEEARYLGTLIARSTVFAASTNAIITLDIGTGQHTRITLPQGAVDTLAMASNGKAVVYKRITEKESEVVVSDGRSEKHVVELNSHLQAVETGKTVTVPYEIEGAHVSSCALLPPNHESGRRYPLVVFVYPNMRGECVFTSTSTFSSWNLQLLAAHGYIVLFPYTARSVIENADGPTSRMTLAVDAAVEAMIEQGYADPDHLGLLGVSQGHHSVLQMLTETARFKAAVVANGISDFASDYGNSALYVRLGWDSFGVGSPGRYENPRSDNWIGAPPWETPDRYVKNSPVFQANKIVTPVLIMHSDLDQFPLGQSEEIFAALYRQRKHAEYVTYWGEGHANLSPANIRDMWHRICRWYDTHL